MSSLWIPGARVVVARQDGGSMLGPADKRWNTWHFTVSNPLTQSMDGMVNFLQNKGAQGSVVHLRTGEIVQMIPSNRACRMLRNLKGGVQTNRAGAWHHQVEIIGMPGVPIREQATPEGIAALQRIAAFARDNGVPDVFPGGGAPRSGSEYHARLAPNMPSGHLGHDDWSENTHWDGILLEDQALILGIPATPEVSTYTVVRGDTLSAIGAKLGIDWRSLAAANGIASPFTIFPGQVLRLPANGSIPAPVPTPAPTPEKVPPTLRYHGDVYMSKMHRGVTDSQSVRNLQQALRDYPGISTIPLNPSGVTGNFGSETEAMVRLMYRTFHQWQPSYGWDQGNPAEPGPKLLSKLGLRIAG